MSINRLLEASGAGAFFLAVGGWQVRAAMLRRRARRRPTASVVSDAIIMGSNSPRTDGSNVANPRTMRRMKPVVSELTKLNEDQWGFSLRDADKVIFTFVYPGREKAEAALKAMRRARKDLAVMELHSARM